MSGVKEMTYYLGVDIGGTKIAVGVGDQEGHILAQSRVKTPVDDADQGLNAIGQQAQSLCAQMGLGLDRIAAVGVGTPGPLDGARLLKTANLPGWEGVDLADSLTKRLGCPTFVQNDATAAAMGEWLYGAGRRVNHMVYVTISTGIGSGLIVNGREDGGAQGNAGEFGHLVVKRQGPPCRCGNFGCLETLASGTAIARRGREEKDRSPFLRRHDVIETKTVFEGAAAGDPRCQAIISEVVDYLGLGLSYLVNLFNPERIVLGGGVMAHVDHAFVEALEAATGQYSIPPMFQVVTLTQAAFKDDSGLVGAFAVAMQGLSG